MIKQNGSKCFCLTCKMWFTLDAPDDLEPAIVENYCSPDCYKRSKYYAMAWEKEWTRLYDEYSMEDDG